MPIIFTKITPQTEIEMTWRWESISHDFNSNIRLSFADANGATRFDFVHENFNVPHEIKPHRESWEQIMHKLVDYASDVGR